MSKILLTEADVRRCFSNKLFKFGNIHTGKHLCWSLFLIKLQSLSLATLLIKYSNTSVTIPVNITKYLRTSSFIEHHFIEHLQIRCSNLLIFTQENSFAGVSFK